MPSNKNYRFPFSVTLFFFFLGLIESISSPQDPTLPTAQSHVIRISSNLVSVPVSVTDEAGRMVGNLGVEDFVIEEDGVPKPIANIVEPGQTPLELALLLDISGSLSAHFQFVQKAAIHFLGTVLRREDRVAIVAIGPKPMQVQARTSNLATALEAVRSLQATRGATAFFDSIVSAARLLQKTAAPETRRVEIVLSDGEDNSSESYRLEDALEEVQRADALLYAINPGGSSIHLNKVSIRGEESLQALAAQTGGAVFLTNRPEEIDSIFQRIANELHAQYLLQYYSPDQLTGAAFRHISVRVPKNDALRIRARQGYYPSHS